MANQIIMLATGFDRYKTLTYILNTKNALPLSDNTNHKLLP